MSKPHYLAAHSDQWLADLKDGRIGFWRLSMPCRTR